VSAEFLTGVATAAGPALGGLVAVCWWCSGVAHRVRTLEAREMPQGALARLEAVEREIAPISALVTDVAVVKTSVGALSGQVRDVGDQVRDLNAWLRDPGRSPVTPPARAGRRAGDA